MSYARQKYVAAAAWVLVSLLAGCASGPGSYVALLRSPDGSLGSVVVRSAQGEQVLSQAFNATALDGNKAP